MRERHLKKVVLSTKPSFSQRCITWAIRQVCVVLEGAEAALTPSAIRALNVTSRVQDNCFQVK
ncbi:hypothetical protein FKM82_025401 [Ascaphus truei]